MLTKLKVRCERAAEVHSCSRSQTVTLLTLRRVNQRGADQPSQFSRSANSNIPKEILIQMLKNAETAVLFESSPFADMASK